MKNIAILTCLKANDVCTGASCLDAFYNKKGFLLNIPMMIQN